MDLGSGRVSQAMVGGHEGHVALLLGLEQTLGAEKVAGQVHAHGVCAGEERADALAQCIPRLGARKLGERQNPLHVVVLPKRVS